MDIIVVIDEIRVFTKRLAKIIVIRSFSGSLKRLDIYLAERYPSSSKRFRRVWPSENIAPSDPDKKPESNSSEPKSINRSNMPINEASRGGGVKTVSF